jgi:hypothetical protein
MISSPADVDLPLYAPDSECRSRRRRRAAWGSGSARVRPVPRLVLGSGAILARWGGEPWAGFLRMIPVPGDDLAPVLDAWWWQSASDGVARDGRLLLGPPRREGTTWRLTGLLRVRPPHRALAVTVELWPHSRVFSRLLMVPDGRVTTSRRYFAAGNSAVDHLTRSLLDCRAVALGGGPELMHRRTVA